MAQEMPWFMEYQKEPTYKGQVKEIKEYYPVMREEPELQDTDYHFYTYSIDRKLSSEYINNVDRLCNCKYYWNQNHSLDSILWGGDCFYLSYFIYDTNNRLEKIVHSYTNNGTYDTVTIVYNTMGYPISTIGDKYSEANKPWFEWYDNGKIKGIGSKYWYAWYEYDNKGRLAKSIGENHTITYTYNEYDDIVEERIYNNEKYPTEAKRIFTYSYKYDEHGNWIEKYRNDKLATIRKIIYYPKYIDLGLQSGTLWKDSNEEGFYSFDSAIAVFNNSLPSKEEMEELINTCKWEWDGANYKITGPNKNYIILPAAGCIIDGTYADAYSICVQGCYWTSTPSTTIADMPAAWNLWFYPDKIKITDSPYWIGLSVRLVKRKNN